MFRADIKPPPKENTIEYNTWLQDVWIAAANISAVENGKAVSVVVDKEALKSEAVSRIFCDIFGFDLYVESASGPVIVRKGKERHEDRCVHENSIPALASALLLITVFILLA